MTTISSTSTTASTYTTSQSAIGIDTSALIEAAVAVKQQPADRIDTQIESIETRITAYQELQSLLLDLQDASLALRDAAGSDGKDASAYLDRTAYIEGDAAESLGATIEQGADEGIYDVEIQQIAKAHKVGSDTFTDPDAAAGLAGSFTLGLVGGDSTSIEVTADQSLRDVAATINDAAADTGVSATILKVSDSEYMLVLSATETGKDIAASIGTGDDVLDELGIASAGSFNTQLQAAQDAVLVFDGVTITRDSNAIDDLIDGMTLQLYSAAPGETVSIEVGADLSSISDAVTAFVDAYNALRDFVLVNQATSSDGGAADDAVLFGDQILRSASSSVQAALAAVVDGLSLREIGITLNSDNELEIDSSVLEEALLTDPDAVRALFAYDVESSSSDLQVLRSGTKGEDLAFTLDVTMNADGTVASASVNGDTAAFTVTGNTISGAEGSAYEGLKFVYTGSSDAIDVAITSGVADKLWVVAESIAGEDDGQLATTIKGLQEQTEDLEERQDFYLEAAERYRDYLTDKYARMEAAATQAQGTLDYLLQLLSSEDS